MNVLEVRSVSKRFGSLVAVRDVSLTVDKGELRAIIGPNGAGKTTFFNLDQWFFPANRGNDRVQRARYHGAARASARRSWHGPHLSSH